MTAVIAQQKTDDLSSRIAETAKTAKEKLLRTIDEDAAAYNAYLHALRLPANSTEDAEFRARKIQEALQQAIEVPYQTALAGFEAMQAAHEIARQSPPAILTDAAAGCEVAFAGVIISLWNISANLKHVKDLDYANRMHRQCASLLQNALKLRQENEILIGQKLAIMPGDDLQ
jgi:formiminotetrahydrofolate cyclodeaminase